MPEEVVSQPLKRQTAYKLWVKDIHSAQSFVDVQSGFTQFSFQDNALVRVNIIGVIIDSFVSGTYGSFVLDDGSGQVRVKVWADDFYLVEGRSVGEMVLVIGRISEFQNERYIRPEIVRVVDADWVLLRRLELVKIYGVPAKEEKVILQTEKNSVPEVEPSLAIREKILILIEKSEEIAEKDLLEQCAMPKEKVMVALYDLLKEGEVFSPKKGFYRLV